MTRRVVCALLLASFAAGPASAQDETTETGTAAEPSAPDAPAARKAPRPGVRAGAGASAWWNEQKLVGELSLTEEQRRKMDAHLDSYRGEAPGDVRRTPFNEALQGGDEERAREELAKLSDLAAASVRTRGELKINVLSVLTDEQRKILVERYPRLISQPWARVMRGGRR